MSNEITNNEQVASGSRKAKRTRRYTRHGLAALKTRVKVRGLAAIDLRTAAGRSLIAWKNDLIASMGGEKAISSQQRTLIELATRTRLYLEHVDGWLMGQPSLVQAKKRSVHPVLLQRQQLADALSRYLDQLGLEKRKQVPTFDEYVRQKAASGVPAATPTDEPPVTSSSQPRDHQRDSLPVSSTPDRSDRSDSEKGGLQWPTVIL